MPYVYVGGGQWEYRPPTSSGGNGGGSSGGGSSNSGGGNNNSSSSNSNKVKYKKVQVNILTGEMNVRPSTKTLRIRCGQTVRVRGLGKFLNGGYFIVGRRLTVSDQGIGLVLSVNRPRFRDTIKGDSKYD